MHHWWESYFDEIQLVKFVRTHFFKAWLNFMRQFFTTFLLLTFKTSWSFSRATYSTLQFSEMTDRLVFKPLIWVQDICTPKYLDFLNTGDRFSDTMTFEINLDSWTVKNKSLRIFGTKTLWHLGIWTLDHFNTNILDH